MMVVLPGPSIFFLPWPRLSLVPAPVPKQHKGRFLPVYLPEWVQGHQQELEGRVGMALGGW